MKLCQDETCLHSLGEINKIFISVRIYGGYSSMQEVVIHIQISAADLLAKNIHLSKQVLPVTVFGKHMPQDICLERSS